MPPAPYLPRLAPRALVATVTSSPAVSAFGVCTTPADESWRLKYAGVTEVKVFFRSVIQVEGPDTVAAIKRARDHTPGTVPLLLEVAVSMLLGCPLARDENVHVLKQSRPGAESYSLRLSDGRQFHFRPHPPGHDATSISVYDRYRNGKEITLLASNQDVWQFFGGLAVSP